MSLATRSKRALPFSLNRSADSAVFGTLRCSSETRVPLVEGRSTSALLVSIARHDGFFFVAETSSLAAAVLTMSAKVKLPVEFWRAAEATGAVGGEGAFDRRAPGFLSSFKGGGGPMLII